MSSIHVLPEIIINQIAAGEVIDRPASIVKELVENSIDAKATRITIKFVDGGSTYISVEDDGIGMSPEDAALCFQRNATSKLSTIQDLEMLSTFGFRGEAVASIASVSYVLMQTSNGQIGTEIIYDSGKKVAQKICSCNRGTLFEIRNLFEKIPARKQFLKSEPTESMHIIRVVRAFILAEPDIVFELYRNGKLLFKSPEQKDIISRTETLFGHFDQYTEIDAQADGMRLTGILFEPALEGVISKPEFLLFVNRRAVTNPMIMRVVRETYAMVRARTVNLGAILFLEFSGKQVDYNVHPQKKEIRFKNEYKVKRFVESAISDALAKKISNFTATENFISPKQSSPDLFYAQNFPQSPSISLSFSDSECNNSDTEPSIACSDLSGLMPVTSEKVFELTCDQGLANFEENTLPMWQFVGTFRDQRFAIFESDSGLIFVDIMAAQQCILLDQFLYNRESIASQLLLMPKTVCVDPEQSEIIDALLPMFHSFGIDIEHFGKDMYKITALPKDISEDMIVDFLQDRNLTKIDRQLNREIFAKKIASYLRFCRYDTDEIQGLMMRLLRCQQFLVAPGDSNVLFEIDQRDLEKKFGLQSSNRMYHAEGCS